MIFSISLSTPIIILLVVIVLIALVVLSMFYKIVKDSFRVVAGVVLSIVLIIIVIIGVFFWNGKISETVKTAEQELSMSIIKVDNSFMLPLKMNNSKFNIEYKEPSGENLSGLLIFSDNHYSFIPSK